MLVVELFHSQMRHASCIGCIVSLVSTEKGEPAARYLQMNRLSLRTKVETPIHDNIRELVTWECKEHGVKS
jgi:hypothetical protein